MIHPDEAQSKAHLVIEKTYAEIYKNYQKALFVVQENNRAQLASEAMTANDIEKLGTLIFGSHNGLQNQYKVSCDELDFLVDQAKESDDVIGSRMMGGGFGGCTINLIDKKQIAKFIEIAAKEYQLEYGKNLTPYLVSIENGSGIIEK